MSAVIKLSSPATHEFWEVPVLYEDDHLLVLDKPASLLLSPDHDAPERPDLMGLLHAGIAQGKPWAQARGLTYLMNAHRLDSEVSGVLLLAKAKPVFVELANVFGADKPLFQYVALVRGSPVADQFDVDLGVAPHPTKPNLMRVDARQGKHANTHFEVRERFTRWTLLTCRPLTSRPHQIRAHLRHENLPVVADLLYGGRSLMLSQLKRNYELKPDREERPLIAQVALHAEQLDLPHPVTGAPLTLTAPWPKDLTVAVKYLRRYAVA